MAIPPAPTNPAVSASRRIIPFIAAAVCLVFYSSSYPEDFKHAYRCPAEDEDSKHDDNKDCCF
jgi:hypothetical protein